MTTPFILIIDDQDQSAFAATLSRSGVPALHTFPADLARDDLERASLIVIDEYLEDWVERDQFEEQPSLYVRDGVALAAVLRASLENRGPAVSRPTPSRTAIVLRTGHLEHLASGLPRRMWPVAVSGRYDLEWVTEKSAAAPDLFVALAQAAAALPSTWDPTDPTPQAAWLDLGNVSWRGLALAQIEECRPPWSTLSLTSSGRVWLSWFIQRILPFPTFLVDDLRAAAYLGLHEEGFRDLLAGGSEIARKLSMCEYKGRLSAFDGRRWWRAGVTSLRQDLLDASGERGTRAAAAEISSQTGQEIRALDMSAPVFTIDRDYQTIAEAVEAHDAVRLQPDEWPVYADDPWMNAEDIQDEPELAKLIVIDDRFSDTDEPAN